MAVPGGVIVARYSSPQPRGRDLVTTAGQTQSGVLATETSTSTTLLGQEGKQLSLPRGELKGLQSTGKSLMPDGLEKDLSPQDVADLLALLGGL